MSGRVGAGAGVGRERGASVMYCSGGDVMVSSLGMRKGRRGGPAASVEWGHSSIK